MYNEETIKYLADNLGNNGRWNPERIRAGRHQTDVGEETKMEDDPSMPERPLQTCSGSCCKISDRPAVKTEWASLPIKN